MDNMEKFLIANKDYHIFSSVEDQSGKIDEKELQGNLDIVWEYLTNPIEKMKENFSWLDKMKIDTGQRFFSAPILQNINTLFKKFTEHNPSTLQFINFAKTYTKISTLDELKKIQTP